MDHLCVIPPEEMKEREEAKKAKDESRRIHREKMRESRNQKKM
jgi:hypothetical protein